MKCISCGEQLRTQRTSRRCDVCKEVLRKDYKGAKVNRKTYESYRDAALQRQYGISALEYDRMLWKQNGRCAICGVEGNGGRRLVVDHDHKTGAVRSLLCDGCNQGLGAFKENPDALRAAISYLLEHAEKALA